MQPELGRCVYENLAADNEQHTFVTFPFSPEAGSSVSKTITAPISLTLPYVFTENPLNGPPF